MISTTIKIHINTKKEPKLSIETINAIEKAKERIKKGKFLTEAKVKKRF